MGAREQIKRKGGRPNKNSDADLQMEDLREKVPEVNDTLNDIDRALAKAGQVERNIKEQRRLEEWRESRGCGC